MISRIKLDGAGVVSISVFADSLRFSERQHRLEGVVDSL